MLQLRYVSRRTSSMAFGKKDKKKWGPQCKKCSWCTPRYELVKNGWKCGCGATVADPRPPPVDKDKEAKSPKGSQKDLTTALNEWLDKRPDDPQASQFKALLTTMAPPAPAAMPVPETARDLVTLQDKIRGTEHLAVQAEEHRAACKAKLDKAETRVNELCTQLGELREAEEEARKRLARAPDTTGSPTFNFHESDLFKKAEAADLPADMAATFANFKKELSDLAKNVKERWNRAEEVLKQATEALDEHHKKKRKGGDEPAASKVPGPPPAISTAIVPVAKAEGKAPGCPPPKGRAAAQPSGGGEAPAANTQAEGGKSVIHEKDGNSRLQELMHAKEAAKAAAQEAQPVGPAVATGAAGSRSSG